MKCDKLDGFWNFFGLMDAHGQTKEESTKTDDGFSLKRGTQTII